MRQGKVLEQIMAQMKTLLYCAFLFGFSASLLALDSIKANAEAPLSNQTSSANKNPGTFVIVGTKPFWGMSIAKTGITYSTPDKKQIFPYVAPLPAEGRTLDLLQVYRLPGGLNNLIVIQKVNSCSDGMSDRQYPYSATLIFGRTVREGCASRK